jgi:hypothetical protein
MELLKGIFSPGSWHKLESSQTQVVVWCSTIIFPFYKVLFTNRLESACLRIFWSVFLKPA